MSVDYQFLHEYVGYEIKRLGKILSGYEISIKELLNKRDSYKDVPQAYRDWQYGRALEKIDAKIDSFNLMRSQLKPRYDGLVEQEKEIGELLN